MNGSCSVCALTRCPVKYIRQRVQTASTRRLSVFPEDRSQPAGRRRATQTFWPSAVARTRIPDGRVVQLSQGTSPLLCAPASTPRPAGERLLRREFALLLYTDGLVEERGQDLTVAIAGCRSCSPTPTATKRNTSARPSWTVNYPPAATTTSPSSSSGSTASTQATTPNPQRPPPPLELPNPGQPHLAQPAGQLRRIAELALKGRQFRRGVPLPPLVEKAGD